MESCFIIVVSGETGGGVLTLVVSGLYPPPPAAPGFMLLVSVGVVGPAGAGGAARAVSEGETRPVSGGAWPTPLSLL
jgi:hypothetical protein